MAGAVKVHLKGGLTSGSFELPIGAPGVVCNASEASPVANKWGRVVAVRVALCVALVVGSVVTFYQNRIKCTSSCPCHAANMMSFKVNDICC